MPFTFKLSKRLALIKASPLVLAAAVFACAPGDRSVSGPTQPSFVLSSPSNPGTVSDLTVAAASDTTVTLAFTEVDDGTGQPASYDVRYGVHPISWGSAADVTRGTCAPPVVGSVIGAQRSCTVLGLVSATGYQFQLVAFRGTLNVNVVFGALSNVASGTTAVDPPPVPVASITVSPATASVAVGQAVQLVATPKDASGIPLGGRVVTWATSNAGGATVSGSGLVSGVAVGAVTITATSGGVQGTAAITVTAPVSTKPATVTDLAVAGVTDTSATLSFTEVTDGTGLPASYDIRWAGGTIAWGSAADVTRGTCAMPVVGSVIGAKRSCTVLGLVSATGYQFQLVAFRGTLNVNVVFGALSNVASGTTAASTAPVAAVTVTASPPPPPGGAWPNEPAGWRAGTDHPLTPPNTPLPAGWSWINTGTSGVSPNAYYQLATDATAPFSPPGVLQAEFPIGFPSGDGPGRMDYVFPSPSQEFYAGAYIKVGSPFQPDESAVQKLWYAVGVQAGILMWLEWYGNDTGVPYQVSLVNNGGAFSNYTAGVPGATTRADGLTVLALGSWHRFEIRWRMPSSAGNDGHVIVWVDGNREIEADFVATPNDLFSELRLSCIWGGIHGTKTETDHIWYDHVIIATP